MAGFLQAIPAVLQAVVSLKNLKSKSTVAGVGSAATGAVIASQTIEPSTPEAIIVNAVLALIAVVGLFTDCFKPKSK